MAFLKQAWVQLWAVGLIWLLMMGQSASAAPLWQEDPAAQLFQEAAGLLNTREFAQAIPLFQQILELYPDSEWADESQALLSASYYNLSNYEQAIQAADKFLIKYPDNQLANNILMTLVASYDQVAQTYQAQGNYPEAMNAYEQSLKVIRARDNRAGEGATLANMGVLYANQGRFTEALNSFQQALGILDDVGDWTTAGIALHNMGTVYEAQRRYPEASAIYQKALTVHRRVGNREGEANTLNSLGSVALEQGDYSDALEVLQQSLVIRQAIRDRAGESVTLHNIGAVYEKQGQYAEAMACYQQALAIKQEVRDRRGQGRTLTNIGFIHQIQEHYTEALDVYEEALTINREVGDPVGEAITLNNVAPIYQAQKLYPEALDTYEQAMTLLETLRANAGGEQGRASFIAKFNRLYARAIALYHQQGQNEQAFFTSERNRARSFLDSLVTDHVLLNDNTAADLLVRERDTYNRRQALQAAIRQAKAAGTDVTKLESQLSAAEKAHQEALAAIAARSDQLAALTPGRSSQTLLDVAGVQQRLETGTALLSFYTLEKQTLAFLITPDHFEVVELPVSREQLTNQVSHLRDLLAFKQPEATQAAAQELYQTLIPDFQSRLPTLPSRLLIVPHGPLHYLPFAALYNSTQAKYLVEQYELVMLPSASVLPFITADRQPSSSDLTALVVGNPTPGDLTADFLAGADPVELPPLPYAQKEAEAIAALYNIEPLFGADATESAVRRQAEQAGIVHLAAHGYYNPAAPLNSLIALAPAPQADGTSSDGWLTVGEVYGLNLKQADLVVLSACQTQLGELSAGDELVGLTRAFIFAGTPSVMASLWNVDDAATAHLMEKFYIHLRAGMSKATALRQAQLDTLADFPDPYYWAAFTLSGDGGLVSQTTTPQIVQTEAEPQSSWLWLVAGLGVLVLIMIGGLLWRQYRV